MRSVCCSPVQQHDRPDAGANRPHRLPQDVSQEIADVGDLRRDLHRLVEQSQLEDEILQPLGRGGGEILDRPFQSERLGQLRDPAHDALKRGVTQDLISRDTPLLIHVEIDGMPSGTRRPEEDLTGICDRRALLLLLLLRLPDNPFGPSRPARTPRLVIAGQT